MADVNGETSVVRGLSEDDEGLDRVGCKALVGHRDLSDDLVVLAQLSKLEVRPMDDVGSRGLVNEHLVFDAGARVDHRR